jgi:hypothetical protein
VALEAVILSQNPPIHVADLVGQTDIAPYVVGKVAQVFDHRPPVPAGKWGEPAFQPEPKALYAAQAADIFIFHDNLPFFCPTEGIRVFGSKCYGAPEDGS